MAFRYFLDRIKKAKQQYGFRLYHYCLMPNHVHLLIQTAKAQDFPKIMQGLLQGFGRWFKSRHGYVGHVWQGRYKSPLIGDESYFLEVGRYIERNPVRAGLVTRPEDFPWSSYAMYAYGHSNELVDEDPYYHRIGSDTHRRQIAYRDFVSLEGPYDRLLDHTLLDSLASSGSHA
jgi:putative transposase